MESASNSNLFGDEWIAFSKSKYFLDRIMKALHKYFRFFELDGAYVPISFCYSPTEKNVICVYVYDSQWGELYVSRNGFIIRGEPETKIYIVDMKHNENAI